MNHVFASGKRNRVIPLIGSTFQQSLLKVQLRDPVGIQVSSRWFCCSFISSKPSNYWLSFKNTRPIVSKRRASATRITFSMGLGSIPKLAFSPAKHRIPTVVLLGRPSPWIRLPLVLCMHIFLTLHTFYRLLTDIEVLKRAVCTRNRAQTNIWHRSLPVLWKLTTSRFSGLYINSLVVPPYISLSELQYFISFIREKQ